MTTGPEAKARLRTLIDNRVGLNDVTVTYGSPTREPEIHREMVFLGAIEDSDTDWSALGKLRRREEYTIAFTVVTFKAGDDEVATEARCGAMLTELVQAVADDPDLSGLLTLGVSIERGSLTTDPSDEPKGWLSVARGHFRCTADVTSD